MDEETGRWQDKRSKNILQAYSVTKPDTHAEYSEFSRYDIHDVIVYNIHHFDSALNKQKYRPEGSYYTVLHIQLIHWPQELYAAWGYITRKSFT